MKYLFPVMIITAVLIALFTGRQDSLTEAVLNSPVDAAELCIYLCGGMCFWGGLMRIAEKSGLTNKLSRVFAFLLGGLFRGLDKNGEAFGAISMNITANLLGLGNAATPLGIRAIRAIKEEEGAGDTATPSMVIFTVLNTASLTLIPSTAISLRMRSGSLAPMEIMPAVWITSVCALITSLTAAVWGRSGK